MRRVRSDAFRARLNASTCIIHAFISLNIVYFIHTTSSGSPTSGRSGGSREPTAYRKFCMVSIVWTACFIHSLTLRKENRERIKAEFPDLKGKDLTAKVRCFGIVPLTSRSIFCISLQTVGGSQKRTHDAAIVQ